MSRNFVKASNAIAVIDSEEDLFLLGYVQTLLKSTHGLASVPDKSSSTIPRNEVIKEGVLQSTGNVKQIMLLRKKDLTPQSLSNFNFMLINYRTWNDVSEHRKEALQKMLSTLILNKQSVISPHKPAFMRTCLFFLITVLLMACSPTGSQRQEPENQTLETILNRKNIRKYRDHLIEKKKIDKLIRAGMAAPSSRDRQPWGFIIITDRKVLNTMTEGLPFARMLRETRQTIIVCGDMTKSSNVWFLDCSVVLQNLLLTAESAGLGTIWMAVHPYPDQIEIVREELQLPDYIMPSNVIPVGYPMQKETPKNKYNVRQIHHNGW